MNIDDLHYSLPYRLLARAPRETLGQERHDSRLMVLRRDDRTLIHSYFRCLGEFLGPGDCIVLNNSRVLPSTVFGWKRRGGKVELQLGPKQEEDLCVCLVFPRDSVRVGDEILIDNGAVTATLLGEDTRSTGFLVRFRSQEPMENWLRRVGRPYHTLHLSKRWDLMYFQTVYATRDGSMEMPAAGRHFTTELILELKARGIEFAEVTLHTGLSSQGIASGELKDHRMPREWCEVTECAADRIRAAKGKGRRIVAVGTTVTRTLETAGASGEVKPYVGFADLFICPGYEFKVIDALITNFHGPKSTRIALAAAFAGDDLTKRCYTEAVGRSYTFYEFGDATLTL
jgi:S-adenosylmethionine:tRNA ribosyltransferase-isomerase